MPRWRKDGKELFYLAGNQFITTIPVVDIRSLELGQPTPLFRTRLVVEGSESITLATRYDVAPNGDRFLLRYPPAEPGPPITVVINWMRALTKE
jgi:eukaryotic-like serine/threonine-protein kinase